MKEFNRAQLQTLNQLVQRLPLEERLIYLENLGDIWPFLQRSSDFVVDERDYNIYSVVRIGNQAWLGENLRYKGIRHKENPKNPNLLYGCLYDWTTTMNIEDSYRKKDYLVSLEQPHQGIAPKGCCIPSKEDWSVLEAHWEQEGIDRKFDFLLAGCYEVGIMRHLGANTVFWSTTQDVGSYAWRTYYGKGGENIVLSSYFKRQYCSCRCLVV